MSSDRELLELAAKAAGYEVFAESRKVSRGNDCLEHFIRIDGRELIWNPLTDDGDALRLAAKLSLVVQPLDAFVTVVDSEFRQWVDKVYDGDKSAATRTAIVRAAAHLGKELP
jgi:hypothetical protein